MLWLGSGTRLVLGFGLGLGLTWCGFGLERFGSVVSVVARVYARVTVKFNAWVNIWPVLTICFSVT